MAQPDEWMVTDGCGEYVRYYNHTGHVMHFTRDRDEAMKTTDSEDAYRIAEIAQRLYGRKSMQMSMVL